MSEVRPWAERAGRFSSVQKITAVTKSPRLTQSFSGRVSQSSTSAPGSPSSYAPVISAASRSLTLCSLIQSTVLGHTQEDVISALVVYPANISSNDPESTGNSRKKRQGLVDQLKNPIILAVSVIRTKTGYRDPKLHQIKVKGTNMLSLKVTRPLKSLECIEVSNNAALLTIATTDGTRASWLTSPNQTATVPTSFSSPLASPPSDDPTSPVHLQFQARTEFVWWVVSAYSVFHKNDLAHNADPLALDALLQRWCRLLLGLDDSSATPITADVRITASSLTPAQRYTIDAANARNRQRLEESAAASLAHGEAVILPTLTEQEERDLRYFLHVCGLDVRHIDQLEARLSARLVGVQRDTVGLVVGAQRDTNSVTVCSLLDQLLERLDEMESWATAHDAALSKMDVGMDEIEQRATALGVEDRNHLNLQHALMWALADVTLPRWARDPLANPDFAPTHVQKLVAAALRLDRLIRGGRIGVGGRDDEEEKDAEDGDEEEAKIGMGKDAGRGDEDGASAGDGSDGGDGTDAENDVGGLKLEVPERMSSRAGSGSGAGGKRGDASAAAQLDARLGVGASAVAKAEQFRAGTAPLGRLTRLQALRDERQAAQRKAADFVAAAVGFLKELVGTLAKRAAAPEAAFTSEDRAGLASGEPQTVLLTKLRTRMAVDKYAEVHRALMPYGALVACCERLQPGTAREVARHYVAALQKVYAKDAEAFFGKLKKCLAQSSVEGRLSACPDTAVDALPTLWSDFYTTGAAARTLAGHAVSGGGVLRVEDAYVAAVERVASLVRAEQLFLLNMFFLWTDQEQTNTPAVPSSAPPALVSPGTVVAAAAASPQGTDPTSPAPTPALRASAMVSGGVNVRALLAALEGPIEHPLAELAVELGLAADAAPPPGTLLPASPMPLPTLPDSTLAAASPRTGVEGRRKAEQVLGSALKHEVERAVNTLLGCCGKWLRELVVAGLKHAPLSAVALSAITDHATDTLAPGLYADSANERAEARRAALREEVRAERVRAQQALKEAGVHTLLSSDDDDHESDEDDAQMAPQVAVLALRRAHLPPALVDCAFAMAFSEQARRALTPSTHSSSSTSQAARERAQAAQKYEKQLFVGAAVLERELGAPTAVSVLAAALADMKLAWNAFVEGEARWVEQLRVNPKQGGVLPPVAKLPVFVECLEAFCFPHRSDAADIAYSKLALAVLQWVHATAATNPKYQHVILMENLHYLCLALHHRRPRIVALQASLLRAKQQFYASRFRYVAWSIAYEMPQLASFWTRLFGELKGHRAQATEVALLPGLTRTHLRALLKDHFTPKAIETGVRNMLRRLARHLPRNAALVRETLLLIREHFVAQCQTFLRAVEMCYVHQHVDTTIADVHEAFELVLPLADMGESLAALASEQSRMSETGRVGASIRHVDVESVLRPRGGSAGLGELSHVREEEEGEEDGDYDDDEVEVEIEEEEEVELEFEDDEDEEEEENVLSSTFVSYASYMPQGTVGRRRGADNTGNTITTATSGTISNSTSAARAEAVRSEPVRRINANATASVTSTQPAAPSTTASTSISSRAAAVSASTPAPAAVAVKSPAPSSSVPVTAASVAGSRTTTSAAFDLPPDLDDTDDTDASSSDATPFGRAGARRPAASKPPTATAASVPIVAAMRPATARASQVAPDTDSEDDMAFGSFAKRRAAPRAQQPPDDDDDDESGLAGFGRARKR